MCCLFGFHDYGHVLTRKQRATLLRTLAIECEDRGTDATGIAYNDHTGLHIYKRPLAAHKMWFRVPLDATVVMGHTRFTTQGSEKHNQNNHPFRGQVGEQSFALAHNGVLNNDRRLRKQFQLPTTQIETDSYIAVQLLESYGKLDFPSMQHMAEQLEGSFTLTVLSGQDRLYFIKGNNPMCIYHFRRLGLYVYASTQAILLKAIRKLLFLSVPFEDIPLESGDMLCIDSHGIQSHWQFNDCKIIDYFAWMYPPIGSMYQSAWGEPYSPTSDKEYLDSLKSVAACYGLYEDDIDELLAEGFTLDDIEEYLYCG